MAKRDNDYYARRLQRDHPQIWHQFQAGIYKSLAEARRAAGLGGSRTRVHEMMNAWRHATAEQRDEFLKFLDSEGVAIPSRSTTAGTGALPRASKTASSAPPGLDFVVAQDGILTPQAIERIKEIIDRRGLRGRFGAPRIGVIMKELTPPFSPHDMSLKSALDHRTRMNRQLIEAIERWLLTLSGV